MAIVAYVCATSERYVLDVVSNGDLATPYATFSGQAVTADSILVRYTYAGDENLDGVVNGTDSVSGGHAWAQGDSITTASRSNFDHATIHPAP